MIQFIADFFVSYAIRSYVARAIGIAPMDMKMICTWVCHQRERTFLSQDPMETLQAQTQPSYGPEAVVTYKKNLYKALPPSQAQRLNQEMLSAKDATEKVHFTGIHSWQKQSGHQTVGWTRATFKNVHPFLSLLALSISAPLHLRTFVAVTRVYAIFFCNALFFGVVDPSNARSDGCEKEEDLGFATTLLTACLVGGATAACTHGIKIVTMKVMRRKFLYSTTWSEDEIHLQKFKWKIRYAVFWSVGLVVNTWFLYVTAVFLASVPRKARLAWLWTCLMSIAFILVLTPLLLSSLIAIIGKMCIRYDDTAYERNLNNFAVEFTAAPVTLYIDVSLRAMNGEQVAEFRKAVMGAIADTGLVNLHRICDLAGQEGNLSVANASHAKLQGYLQLRSGEATAHLNKLFGSPSARRLLVNSMKTYLTGEARMLSPSAPAGTRQSLRRAVGLRLSAPSYFSSGSKKRPNFDVFGCCSALRSNWPREILDILDNPNCVTVVFGPAEPSNHVRMRDMLVTEDPNQALAVAVAINHISSDPSVYHTTVSGLNFHALTAAQKFEMKSTFIGIFSTSFGVPEEHVTIGLAAGSAEVTATIVPNAGQMLSVAQAPTPAQIKIAVESIFDIANAQDEAVIAVAEVSEACVSPAAPEPKSRDTAFAQASKHKPHTARAPHGNPGLSGLGTTAIARPKDMRGMMFGRMSA